MGASQTAAQSWIRETATRQHPAPMEPLTPPLAAASSPPPPPLHAPAEPSLTSQTKSALRSALDLEEVLGTNWLNKIGVSILVLGIASFLAYQIRTLGPPGKVLAGYLAGSVMLGAGIWFERLDRYRILARAGVGGGWALLFFVTYAMYHVSAARVLSSQTTDLVLMLAVASAMVWHTLHYRSQVVTGLAFLLAFLTVTISHETVYSLTAGTVLAAALAVIAVRMRWFDLEAAGIAGTYLNHFLWLRPIIEPMHGKHRMFPEFFASAAILVAYWVIYRASYLCRRPDNARQENVSAAAALLNTAALLGLLKYQSVHPEWAFWALLAIGGVETALGQLPMARRRRTAAVVLSTLGAVLLIAAFPFRYSAARLSMLWLAEAEAMFLIGVWVREVVFRRVGLLAVATVAWQMLGVDAARVCGMRFDGAYVHSDPALAILFLVATVIFYLDAHWVLPRFPELFRAEFDRIVAERFSYAGFVLGLTGAWIAFPAAWTAVAWCALALLMGVAGERLRIPHLGYQGKLLAAAAALRAAAANFGATGKLYGVTQRLITVALVSLLLYVTTRLKIDDRGGKLTIGSSAFAYTDVVSGFCSWAASLLLSLLAWYELRAVSVAVAWAIGGLALLELGVARRSVAL
ncbi:MAG TPA: DUF2339 domain-containing protein, partial [Terriglobales bacterium]|nr:DUF2339 domain-containing protein [Terriglobales bacterium]